MKEAPMLFSGEMVRAIIDGRKTMTRRIVCDRNSVGNFKWSELDQARAWAEGAKLKSYLAPAVAERLGHGPNDVIERLYPRIAPASEWDQQAEPRDGYVPPASRLWVRETFFDHDSQLGTPAAPLTNREREERVEYRESEWDRCGGDAGGGWKPSIHMPRWASRINLEVTEVRVERLQEITEADAIAEGMDTLPIVEGKGYAPSMCHEFRCLWNSLNADRGLGWDANPFVWVIGFRRVTG